MKELFYPFYMIGIYNQLPVANETLCIYLTLHQYQSLPVSGHDDNDTYYVILLSGLYQNKRIAIIILIHIFTGVIIVS
jgi:hypothetical protein